MKASVRNKTLCIVHCALCIFMLAGCRPRSVLSPTQMEDIFVDLHTADGLLQEAGLNYGHDEQVQGYYQLVLEKHHTTQEQFDSSLIWYTAHPTFFDKIYPKVVERLQKQLDEYAEQIDDAPQTNLLVKSVDEWLQECRRGPKVLYWQQNEEKSAEKFVYVKKM